MSYILDALRKSDQQRQQGATPTLMSVPLAIPEPRQRTWSWRVALAALLFIMGILVGWWRPWHADLPQPVARPETPAAEIAVQPLDANAPSLTPAPLSAPPMSHDFGNETERTKMADRPPQSPPVAPVAAIPGSAPAVSQGAVEPTVAVVADNLRATAVKPATAAPQESGAAASGKQVSSEPNSATTEQKILTRAELTVSIQQEIPKLSVSLHAYSSKPKDRLVGVNDQLLHEGDTLSPGLILEQITPQDMIFSYKGFRFRQGVH